MITRPLTGDSGYTCDWGGCDQVAVVERQSPEYGWLPVCERHGPRQRRQSPRRAQCPACGKDYALSVSGLLPLHRNRLDTCTGSRTTPAIPPEGGER